MTPLRLVRVLMTFQNSILHTPFTNTSYVTRVSEPLSTSPPDIGPCTHPSFRLSSITAILISRFILDLHDTHRALARHGGLVGIQIMASDVGRPCSSDIVSLEMAKWSVASNTRYEAGSGC